MAVGRAWQSIGLCLAISLSLAKAHTPFFDTHHVDGDINRATAYYWKRTEHGYVGTVEAHRGNLPRHTRVAVSLHSTTTEPCDIVVSCDGTKHSVPTFNRPCEQGCDPLTQTGHCVVHEQSISCFKTFSVSGKCSVAWRVELGHDHKTLLGDAAMTAGYTARLHGSWWANSYVTGWLVMIGGVVVAGVVVHSHDTPRAPSLPAVLAISAATVSASYMLAKLYHAQYECGGDAQAVGVALAELPFIAACFVLVATSNSALAPVCIAVFALVSFFVVGIGYSFGNWLLLAAAIGYKVLSPMPFTTTLNHRHNSDSAVVARKPKPL